MIQRAVGPSTLELIQGNIVEQDTDAIVNAANTRLTPGGGVSGAIHRAAGPGLWQQTKTMGGCRTGQAKLSSGYNLKAAHVIHTVGPVHGTSKEDPELLRSCYKRSLELATANNIRSISFPSISTGIFGYPVAEASHIALSAVLEYLETLENPLLVRFVLFSKQDLEAYTYTLLELERKRTGSPG
jgi:O-acetyl-ADP-ribose deacetylase (regulator of RNase III)